MYVFYFNKMHPKYSDIKDIVLKTGLDGRKLGGASNGLAMLLNRYEPMTWIESGKYYTSFWIYLYIFSEIRRKNDIIFL